MEPSGALSLTRYSRENFPSRTTQSHLLPKKDEIRPNTRLEIPQDFSLRRRTACQTLSKALDILSVIGHVAPDLLKALAILSDTSVRRSTVDREDHKTITRNQKKKATFLQVINKPVIYKFFKDFANHRKKNNRVVIFSHRLFYNILKYMDHQGALQTIYKTRLLQIILKTAASIYESSCSQFFRQVCDLRFL